MSISNDNTTTPTLSSDLPKRTGIVLNRMYTGSYLSSNLGHEVINMFQDDDGNHYMYLNATGDFSAEHVGRIGSMLLIKYAGQDEDRRPWVEVLGCAIGLKDIYDPSESNEERKQICTKKVFKGNDLTFDGIRYGEVPINKIFDGSTQQDILISYHADKLLVPKEDIRIFLRFAPFRNQSEPIIKFASSIIKDENTDSLEFDSQIKVTEEAQYIWQKVDGNVSRLYSSKLYVVELETKFASTSLKRYYSYKEEKGKDADKIKKSNSDLKAIASLIAKGQELWQDYSEGLLTKNDTSQSEDKNIKKKDVSIFDICRIENNENCFSNALAHFMDKYRVEWCTKFFKDKRIDLNENFEIFREVDATIPKNNNCETDNTDRRNQKGGRIDLLLKDENNIIIIENKIKSDINGVKGESEGKQLEIYQKYAQWLKFQPELDKIKDELHKLYVNSDCFDVHQNSGKVKITQKQGNKQPRHRIQEEGESKKKNWEEFIDQEIEDLDVHLFVLSPNYNIPHIPKTCKNWKTITYQEISDFLEKHLPLSEDTNLEDFFNVMQRHKCENLGDWLRIDMRNKFLARISKIK